MMPSVPSALTAVRETRFSHIVPQRTATASRVTREIGLAASDGCSSIAVPITALPLAAMLPLGRCHNAGFWSVQFMCALDTGYRSCASRCGVMGWNAMVVRLELQLPSLRSAGRSGRTGRAWSRSCRSAAPSSSSLPPRTWSNSPPFGCCLRRQAPGSAWLMPSRVSRRRLREHLSGERLPKHRLADRRPARPSVRALRQGTGTVLCRAPADGRLLRRQVARDADARAQRAHHAVRLRLCPGASPLRRPVLLAPSRQGTAFSSASDNQAVGQDRVVRLLAAVEPADRIRDRGAEGRVGHLDRAEPGRQPVVQWIVVEAQ